MARSFIIILFSFILNLFGNVLMFANVDISGNVCDKNNQPIDSVRVDIISTDTTTVYTNSEGYFDISIITGIGKNISSPVQDFELTGQNYPNPFYPRTTIKVSNYGTLEVYNIVGHKVLENKINKVNSRIHLALSSGIYLYRFIDDQGKKSDTKRMVLLDGGNVYLDIIQQIKQADSFKKNSEYHQIKVIFSHTDYFSSDTLITLDENNPVMLDISLYNRKINLMLEEAYRSTGLIAADSGGIVEAISSEGVKYRLNIPPRALLSDIEVDLVPVKVVTNLPLPSQFIAAVDVQSDSLDLMLAAILTIELPNQVTEKVIGFHSQSDGSRFHLSPMRVDGNIIQFVTYTFSPLGFLQFACDNITAYDYPSQNQLERGKQRIAILNSLSSNCEVFIVEEYEEAYMDIHYDWFFSPNDGVSSFINQAEINLDPASLKAAVREFLAWHNSLYYHQDVEITPDLVDFKAIPGCIVDGSLCENLQNVANAAVVRLWDVIEYLIWDLNNACSAGDPTAENQALALINLADILVNRPYIDDVSYDIEDLVALKSCGSNSVIIIPGSAEILVDDQIILTPVALDKNGLTIENYFERSDVFVEWRYTGDAISISGGKPGLNVTGEKAGLAKVMFFVTGPKGSIMHSAEADIEVIDRYRLTWSFNATWVLEEAVPGCSSVEMSGDGFWEGSAVIEEHVLDSDKFYEITSISCDGLIQGNFNNACEGWITYSNSYLSDMDELRSRILNSFDLYTVGDVKYMVDPFKNSGSAYPLNFLGMHEGSFNLIDEEYGSYAQDDYSFEDAWGTLISPTTTFITTTGAPFQIPQNYVIVFSNEDSDILSDDPEGNSYTKSLQHLYAGVFDNIPGEYMYEPSGVVLPVNCDVEIKLVRISGQ